uniref:Uncharacterized protein n=1 Tax=Aegilops tauschii subsp. strangulata TaxID=200361 RepID=A0A453IJW8_AEGTS
LKKTRTTLPTAPLVPPAPTSTSTTLFCFSKSSNPPASPPRNPSPRATPSSRPLADGEGVTGADSTPFPPSAPHLMFLSRIVLRDLDSIDSPASMATSKKVVTRDEWERKLRDVKIRKEDMNRLVMNFLVTEGFVDAADKFRVESGTQRTARLAATRVQNHHLS